jgi:1,2-diacylglycerol 3-beta-glucosyltransferase
MILATAGFVVAAFFALPLLSDLIALARIATGRGRKPRLVNGGSARILYLVPAHNEELLIAETIRSVRGLHYPAARSGLIVIADNCQDATAARVRELGAECLERNDLSTTGKPAALAWAFDRIDLTLWDAVVVLDADTVVDPGHARALSTVENLRDKVAAGFDDVRNRGDSALTRMAAVFAQARFRSAYRLKQLAGLNIPLSNGLCIGTGVLLRHRYRATSLSEDLELYADLTAQGVVIELAAGAHTYAQETKQLDQSSSQRARWFAGRLQVVRRIGPALLSSRTISTHQKLDTLVELSIPGPAVQGALCAALALALLYIDVTGGALAAGLLLATLVRPATYAAIGIWLDPEPGRAIAAFSYLPVYAIWRCAVMLKSASLLRGGGWIRTARHTPS